MKKNKSILILGVTGMVGGELLQCSLNHPLIQKVYTLSRRKLNIQNSKLLQIIHPDFNDYSQTALLLKQVDAVFYCIGVYTGKANKEVFCRVTIDFPVNLAKAIQKVNPYCVFCYLSGNGADNKEKSRMIFARTKGIAENQLKALMPHFYTFRPNYIYPIMPRKEINFMYRLSRHIYRLLFYSNSSISKSRFFKTFTQKTSITSQQLAMAMLHVGLYRNRNQFIEHNEIHLIHKKLVASKQWQYL